MGIFRKRKSPEAEIPRIHPEVEAEPNPANTDTIERELSFENKFEAGAYVVDLLSEAEGKIMDFYQDAKSRGMEDGDIMAAIKDAVLGGYLPAIAERLGPPRGGSEPIFFIDTLAEEDKERLDVHKGEKRVKVSVLSNYTLNELLKQGKAIVITPRQAAIDPQLVNHPSDWVELTTKLEQTVHSSSHKIEK